ncbi:hypothetical protein Y032_1369g3850 [Ancylostoma ceylanicum]|uniref:Uncharacterized protein n=1 Tax=Ancylostoma ceylanicum TaxID=53326 RepID=A0A016SB69_9BILA|nr:hypothetical protein Y032_0255g317 [Ancylostoma ceylanicum]EYB87896.1 hypothetical protein Y032_0255g318 [Ancylostoma ceylanicum]EYC34828.1 hypothetical protein Y032_1369g3850 [Ancylostoma ceylanicum]
MPGYESTDGGCIPCGAIMRKTTEYGSDDGGWVRLEQAVVISPGYGPVLVKQCGKLQDTSPPLPSIGKNAGHRSGMARHYRKRQDSGLTWPNSEESGRIRALFGQVLVKSS